MVMNMNLLLRTIQKEKQRIDYMLNVYAGKLDELPKGSLSAKKSGNNVYYYLKYRAGQKVVTEYLGKDEAKIEQVRDQLEKRRHIEAMIKSLREEQELAGRVLEG